MPRTCTKSKGETSISPKKKGKSKDAISNGKVDAQNVNSNHSTVRKWGKTVEGVTPIKVKKTKATENHNCKAKEQENKVFETSSKEMADSDNQNEKVQFREDGDLIVMEINDGGAAAAEFASETEDNSDDSESEMDETSDDGTMSEGEIPDDGDGESQDEQPITTASDSEIDNPSQDQYQEGRQTYRHEKKKRKKDKRKSMEDKIDTMSNTLLAWQEIMMKNGLLNKEATDGSKKNKEKRDVNHTGELGLTETNSETTIYRNILDKQVAREIDVDSEIMFRVKQINGKDEGNKREIAHHLRTS